MSALGVLWLVLVVWAHVAWLVALVMLVQWSRHRGGPRAR